MTAIRRLACDANLIPVVLGGPSGILDIGRTSPSWPLSIRRAAALRDQGCTYPGCHAPIAYCELHHIAHWIQHRGPTSLFNATHLCVRHHHLVHNHGWTLTRHPDGTLTFTGPQGTTPPPGSHQPPSPTCRPQAQHPRRGEPPGYQGQPDPAHPAAHAGHHRTRRRLSNKRAADRHRADSNTSARR